MESDSRVGRAEKATLEALMRERIRATIEAIVDEELVAALGASRSARVGAIRTCPYQKSRLNGDLSSCKN